MARRRRRNKKTSMIEDLLDLPWQVSAGFGVAVLIVLKGIVPAIVSGNIYLHPLLAGLSGAAWLFSCAFFLIAAIVFAKEKMTKGKTQAIEPAIGSRAISRKERQEPVYSPSASAKQADQYPPPPPKFSISLGVMTQRSPGAPVKNRPNGAWRSSET